MDPFGVPLPDFLFIVQRQCPKRQSSIHYKLSASDIRTQQAGEQEQGVRTQFARIAEPPQRDFTLQPLGLFCRKSIGKAGRIMPWR